MRALLRAMEPTRFEDIAAVLALYRPGPMAANAHIDYADRKNGRKQVAPIHPELRVAGRILGPTYRLLVFQEQIMAIARKLAGYTLGGADLLRRAMGKKKPRSSTELSKFAAGMQRQRLLRRGHPGAVGRPGPVLRVRVQQVPHRRLRPRLVLDRLPEGQLPGRVHGGAAHLRRGRQGQVGHLPGRCRRMGVKVLPPDVNESVGRLHRRSATTSGSASARSATSATNVVDVDRRGPQGQGRLQLVHRLPATRSTWSACNKRAVESLIKAGAFDSLDHTRQGLLAVHEPGHRRRHRRSSRHEAIGQVDLFGELIGGEPATRRSASTSTRTDGRVATR